METTENNKLIAEFMDYPDLGTEGDFSYLKYHKSWDWLMPVIEKIETLGYKFEKNYQPIDQDWQSLIVKGNDILYQEFSENSLDSSYYVVVEFIKELNKQN
jgi:hypothetical protein